MPNYQKELFPDVAVELQNEIYNNHPELLRLLSKYPGRGLEVKVATIAAYCNIGVDGYFFDKDLEVLFELLLKKLKEKNTIIIEH